MNNVLEILEKIYSGDEEDLIQDMLSTHDRDGFVIVDFLYFSLVVAHNLFLGRGEQSSIQKNYKKALLNASFLLPDGIALQLFYFFARVFRVLKTGPFRLPNLNGTDFVPYFLNNIKRQGGSQSLTISLYGTKDTYLKKAEKYLKYHGYNVIYTQNGFSDFEWSTFDKIFSEYTESLNILLVGMSTPTKPLQELWADKHHRKIKNSGLIVMNVGGLLDFLSGAQKRAPLRIRKIKLEWLYRLLTDSKRNLKKVKNSFSLFPYIFRYLLLKKK